MDQLDKVVNSERSGSVSPFYRTLAFGAAAFAACGGDPMKPPKPDPKVIGVSASLSNISNVDENMPVSWSASMSALLDDQTTANADSAKLYLDGILERSGTNLRNLTGTFAANKITEGLHQGIIEAYASEGSQIFMEADTTNFEALGPTIVNLYGTLESNETDSPREGFVEIYDMNLNLLDSGPTDAQGNWDFEVDVHQEYVVRAMITENGQQFGYWRSTIINLDDILESHLIRAVPFDDFGMGVTPDDYRLHVCDENDEDGDNVRGVLYEGTAFGCVMRRWNFNDLQGIYIFETTPELDGLGNPVGKFSSADQDFIENEWMNILDIPAFLRNTIQFNIVKGSDQDQDPPYEVVGNGFTMDSLWMGLRHDTGIPRAGSGFGTDSDQDGYFERGLVAIKYTPTENPQGNDRVITHESGQALGHRGQGRTLPPELTAYFNDFLSRETPGPADVKTFDILYEETFHPLEHLNNILWLDGPIVPIYR